MVLYWMCVGYGSEVDMEWCVNLVGDNTYWLGRGRYLGGGSGSCRRSRPREGWRAVLGRQRVRGDCVSC